jgi:hypothetical protein
MSALCAKLANTARPVIWLDFDAYAERLIGPWPWLDQAAFAAAYGKAHGLLRPDVVALDAGKVLAVVLAARPALKAEMTAKRRAGYPLKVLLADKGVREAVAQLLVPLRASHANAPLMLVLPAPRRWLAEAYAAAHGHALAHEVADDGDNIDGAAVYIADFLRAFANSGIDGVLLHEVDAAGPADAEQLEWWFQPVINVCKHYRWELGLLDAGTARLPFAEGLSFLISGAAGQILGPDFWDRGGAPAGRQLLYGAVPATAEPETVLARLKTLR